MWTSERSRNLSVEEPAAELGTITLGGDPAGVSLGGERRWLSVYGPGGYSWRPTSGDRVLVLKAGAEGESPCILGMAQGGENLKEYDKGADVQGGGQRAGDGGGKGLGKGDRRGGKGAPQKDGAPVPGEAA